MHLRRALPLLACCAWLAGGLPSAASGVVAVYGLELEVDEERERLLIFADAPLEPQLIEVDPQTLMIALPGSELDASAPTRITPAAQGTVRRVTAFDRARASEPPEVRIVVQRRPGAAPRIERRASVVAVEFEPRPRIPAAAPDATVSMAYHNAPLAQIVTDIGRATGETFIYDESLIGELTVEGPARVSREEALALLDSMLLLRGFAAVPAPGGGRRIVLITGAPGPWVPLGPIAESDAPVTTLLRLETARAEDLIPVLSPYLGAQSVAVAFAPTNSLILAGPASQLNRLRSAVEALDRIEVGRLVIRRLQYGDAAQVAEQVREILGERAILSASGDERTNAVMLRVQPEHLDRARALVDRLDRPAEGLGEFHVVGLRYLDPETIAERLEALRDDQPSAADAGVDPASRRVGLRGREFQVAVDAPTHSLVVRAAPETFAAVLDVVRELDREPTSVRVEVTVATVVIDARLELGIDYLIPTLTNPKTPQDLIAAVLSTTSTENASKLKQGIPLLPTPDRPFVATFTRAPLLLTLTDPTTGLPFVIPVPRESVSISLNGREVRTETLIRPQLLATSGEEHEIFAGDNIPIKVARSQGQPAQSAAAPSEAAPSEAAQAPRLEVRQNIERQDVGTSLRLVPTVGAQGGVLLELDLEVSTLEESAAGDVEIVGPSIREITVQSKIRLAHGDLAVIATAGDAVKEESESGVPWLKEIPWLGFLFRNTRERDMRSILLIAAQAEIVRPDSQDLARELERELQKTASNPSTAQRER